MSPENKYLRFSISDRIEHWVQMASFTTLGLTGLVQKFSGSPFSVWFIGFLGGIEAIRIIHRVASIGLMLGSIYHIGVVGYKYYVQRSRITMLPSIKDVQAAWGIFLHNLRLKKNKPQQGRYSFDEKFEYWAFVWGTVVMGLTGFMLWNPITTSKFMPGIVIPAAKAAHSGEALLAVLAIIIWHFYNVHIKHFNKSMFTGYLSEHEMLEEHPIELADIKAGITEIPQDPQKLAKRKKIYIRSYSIVVAFLLGGVIFFVAGEKTAIATVPPAEDVAVFVQFTPTPLPTPLPTPTMRASIGSTWDEGISSLLTEKCGTCHMTVVMGGLDLSNYQGAITGGLSGSAVFPGNSEASILIQRQLEGDHPGQLSQDELNFLKAWIDDGAPEN